MNNTLDLWLLSLSCEQRPCFAKFSVCANPIFPVRCRSDVIHVDGILSFNNKN